MSSETIAPKSPKRAPDAPTEMPFLMKRAESMLPPNPDKRYIMLIRTADIQDIERLPSIILKIYMHTL